MIGAGRFIAWWSDWDWAVKFFAAMIAGSMAIAVLFTAIVILPVWIIDMLIA